MVLDNNNELKEKQQKLLAELRKIVGRGFEFSHEYMLHCNWECNRIGRLVGVLSFLTNICYIAIGSATALEGDRCSMVRLPKSMCISVVG